MHPVGQLVDLLHAPLLQEVQRLRHQHDDRPVVGHPLEDAEHAVGEVAVGLRGRPQFVVDVQHLAHVVLVLRAFELALAQHCLHQSEQSLLHLPPQPHPAPAPLPLPLLVVGVLDHRLDLGDDGQVAAGTHRHRLLHLVRTVLEELGQVGLLLGVRRVVVAVGGRVGDGVAHAPAEEDGVVAGRTVLEGGGEELLEAARLRPVAEVLEEEVDLLFPAVEAPVGLLQQELVLLLDLLHEDAEGGVAAHQQSGGELDAVERPGQFGLPQLLEAAVVVGLGRLGLAEADGVVEADQQLRVAAQFEVDAGQQQPDLDLVELHHPLRHAQRALELPALEEVARLVVQQVGLVGLLLQQALHALQTARGRARLEVEFSQQEGELGDGCGFGRLGEEELDGFDGEAHQSAFAHVVEHQGAEVAAARVGLRVEVVPQRDVLVGGSPEQNCVETAQLSLVVLRVVKEVVVAAPRQVGGLHGPETAAEVGEVHVLGAHEFLLVGGVAPDAEVAGDADLDDHVAPVEEVVDEEDAAGESFLALALALGLVAEVDGEVLRVGIESLEEEEAPPLLLLAQEGRLLHEVVGRCVRQPHSARVPPHFLPPPQQHFQRFHFHLRNHKSTRDSRRERMRLGAAAGRSSSYNSLVWSPHRPRRATSNFSLKY